MGRLCRAHRERFGDVLLDVIVRLEEPLAPGGDVRAATRAGAGGQAANVAAWAAELGAEATLHREAGRRPGGRARRTRARGARRRAPRPGRATARPAWSSRSSRPATERSPRTAASATTFAPDELDAAWLACDVLHVSGYALVREPIGATALLAARLAREAGARISVDVAAWTEIRRFGPVRFRELLDELAPDVLFATEAEWELLGGAYLSAPTGVLKRGARGCSVFTADSKLDFAAMEVGRRRPDRSRGRARRRVPAGRLARGSGAARDRGGCAVRRESRVAAVNVEALSDDQAAAIAEWRYEFPYEWYDTSADPRRVELFANPARRTHLRAVVDGDELVGFFNFVPDGDEVRIGLGMRPDLTGRGLAQPFIEAGLDYARREWRPRHFRLWVARWNERALRAYRRAGFREVAVGRGEPLRRDGAARVSLGRRRSKWHYSAPYDFYDPARRSAAQPRAVPRRLRRGRTRRGVLVLR